MEAAIIYNCEYIVAVPLCIQERVGPPRSMAVLNSHCTRYLRISCAIVVPTTLFIGERKVVLCLGELI